MQSRIADLREILRPYMVALAAMLAAALLIACYRVIRVPTVGNRGWAAWILASVLLWILCLALLALAVPTHFVAKRVPQAASRFLQRELLSVAPVLAVAFLSSRVFAERVFFACIAAVISLAVGRLLAGSDKDPRSGWNARQLATAALFVALLASAWLPSPEPTDMVGLESLETTGLLDLNLVVVGVDGLDWSTVQDMVFQGRLPNFENLIAQGAAGPLHTLRPTSSPFIWNSIYTGFSPALHRRRPVHYAVGSTTYVSALTETEFPDVLEYTMSAFWPTLRYPRAIWDVFETLGRDTVVIGAWEQYPAPQQGRMFLPREFEIDPLGDANAVPEFGAESIWMEPGFAAEIQDGMVAAADIPAAEWADVVGGDFDTQAWLEADFRPDDPEAIPGSRMAELRAVYASDRFRLHATNVALDRLEPPFFLFTYFRGVDIANHDYAHQLIGSLQPQDPPDVVDRYYEIVDRWIGEIWEQTRDDSIIVVVSDHGFDGAERFSPYNAVYRTGTHDYAPFGTLIVAGGEVEPGLMANAHVFDVAPTLLALFHVPNLATTEGTVLEDITEPSLLVSNWTDLEPSSLPAGNPALSDPALLKQLKALGYIR